jgi:hypothetical protein
MKIDGMYYGPSQSKFIKKVNGMIQTDKRIRLSNSLNDISKKLNNWKNINV